MTISSLSTLHGPAMTGRRFPPNSASPTFTILGVALNSRLASLKGWRMGTTLSTPGMTSRDWRRAFPRSSPTAPMTVRCVPQMTCGW